MKEQIYITNNKTFTFDECEKLIDDGIISEHNLVALSDHLCIEELAKDIISITEQNGVLFINIGTGNFIAISKNKL